MERRVPEDRSPWLKSCIYSALLLFSTSGFAVSEFENCTTVSGYQSNLPDHVDGVIEPQIKLLDENATIVAPTPAQRATFSALLPVLAEGRCPSSQALADAQSIDYEFVLLTDSDDSSKEVLGLQPRYAHKDHGWGSYFYKVGATPRTVIEVVHPLYDTFTPEIGARTFHHSSAHAYFIAGSHRGALWDNSTAGTDPDVHDLGNNGQSDPPDLLASFFNVAHQYASVDSVLVMQVHAYGDSTAAKFPDNEVVKVVSDYNPDTKMTSDTNVRPLKAVVSTGASRLNPHCVNLDRALEKRLGRTGVFLKTSPGGTDNRTVNTTVDSSGQVKVHSGNDYRFLGATHNLHGQETRAGTHEQTGFFCHVELSRDARSPVLEQDATVIALAEAIDAGVETTQAVSQEQLLWSMNREANWHDHNIDFNQDWGTLADNVSKTWPNEIVFSQSYGYEFEHNGAIYPLAARRIYANQTATVSENLCHVESPVDLAFLPRFDDNAVKAWDLNKPAAYPADWNFAIQSSKTLSSSSSEGGISARVSANTKAVLGLVDSADAFSQGTAVKYGFVFDSDGQWVIYQNGVALAVADGQGRMPSGSYEHWDQFIISRDGSDYIFRQAQQSDPGVFNEVYRLQDAVVSVRLHAAIHDSQGQLGDIKASFATDFVSLRSGSVSLLSKPPGMVEDWNYGFQSQQSVASGRNAKIRVEIHQAATESIFGFEDHADPFHKGEEIDYGFRFFADGRWQIYVDGQAVAGESGSYSVGDDFRIERKGSKYTFRKGTKFLHSVNGDSTLALKLHIAIHSGSGGFDNVYASFADGPLLALSGSDQANLTRIPRRLHLDGLYAFNNGDVAFSLSQDYLLGMANYNQCSSCIVMKNGDVFRYHQTGEYAGQITRILRESSATDGLGGSEDNIDGLHIEENAEGGIDAMYLSYSNDGVALLNSQGVAISYDDGDIIKVTPDRAPLPYANSAKWTGQLYLAEGSYLAEGTSNGDDEDISALSIHDGRLVVSIVSAAALDTDAVIGESEEETSRQIILANDLRFSDGATVYLDRDENAADPAIAPVTTIELFTEQGELFSNGTKSNRYHSDIGAMHLYSCANAQLPSTDTSQPVISVPFSITQSGYSIYQTVGNTLYLVSDNGVDVYMIVQSNGTRVIVPSSKALFMAAETTLQSGYTVRFEDHTIDGNTDLVLVPAAGSELTLLVVSDIAGGFHQVIAPDDLSIPASDIADGEITVLDRPLVEDVVGQLAGGGGISGGQVHYSVPIEVPPGRRGMQPQLALQYNSGSGNGLVGKGWDLAAQSAISRCGANWTEDGSVDRVDLQDNDKLCLDGQKLVLISTGNYGESNSEYRTREDSFNKIVLKGGDYSSDAAYFEVIGKDGRVSYYGNTDDSVLKPKGSTVPLSWAVSKVYDNAVIQNNILYSYSNADGEQLLTDIYYTGQNDDQGNRRVQLSYEARTDVSFGYIGGGTTKSTQRLTDVTTWVGQTKVYHYQLLYHDANALLNGHSRLASIEQCGFEDDGLSAKCVPKKTFSYSGDYLRFDVVESTEVVFNSDYPWAIANQMLSDFNNDGIIDFARNDKVHLMSFDDNQYVIEKVLQLPFASYGAVEDPSEIVKLGQLDFDGNGQLEFIGVNDSGNLAIAMLNQAKDGFDEIDLGIWMYCYVIRTHSETYAGTMTSSLDFKPKNTCQVEAISDETGGHYLFHRSAGQDMYLSRIHPDCSDNICGEPQLISGIDKSMVSESRYSERPPAYQFMDFDGDGDPDIVRIEEISSEPATPVQLVWFRNDQTGSGYTASNSFVKQVVPFNTILKGFAMAGGGSHWIDVNGDGLQDLLINSGEWYLMINQGGVLSAPIATGIDNFDRSNICVMNCIFEGPEYTTHPSIRIVDFNSDGLQDFMYLDRAIAVRANGNNDPDQRDCLSDRHRSYCKEGSGSESPSANDFSISPLAYGKYSVYLSKLDSSGNVSFEHRETDIVGSMNNFYPLDINSDGNMDFIGSIRQYDGTTIYRDENDPYPSLPTQVFFHLGKSDTTGIQPDLLLVAEDLQESQKPSFGQKDNFVYMPFSRHKVISTGSAAVDNSDMAGKRYYRVPTTQTVAVQHNATNALGGINTTNYVYGDAFYHQAGLGFLGFDSIETIDLAQGTNSKTSYLLEYPLNGKDSFTEVRENADNSLLQSAQFTWCDPELSQCHSKDSGVFATRLQQSVSNHFDPDGNALKTETVSYNSYDDYGNITQQTRVISDISTVHTTVIDKVYLPADSANWWVDKLDYAEIVKSVSYTQPLAIATGTNGNKTQRRTVSWKAGNARQVASESISGSGSDIIAVTTYDSYDSYGNTTKVTQSGTADELVTYSDVQVASVTEYDHSASDGYFINVERNGVFNGDAITRSWDDRFGAVITETNINGIELINELDWFGRTVKIISNVAPEQDIVFAWGGDGIFQTTTVQDGGATSIEAFDRDGQVVSRRIQAFADNPSGQQSLIELFDYDGLGRLVRQVAPHFSGGEQASVSYSDYDVLNRFGSKTVNRSGENYTVTYGYNGIDTQISLDAGSSGLRTMARRYNGRDQLLSTQDADGNFTYFNYDANDNVIVVKDVANQVITAMFDGFGYKQWFNDPNLGYWQFRHNALGQLRWQKDANGIETRFDYDGLGRQVQRHINDQIDSSWIYDTQAEGLLSSESRDGLTKSYLYDGFARLIKQTTVIEHEGGSRSFELEYGWDSYYGRVKGMRYPTGELLAYQFDPYGYKRADVNPNNGDAAYYAINTMSQQGKVSSALYGNGLYGLSEHTSSGDVRRVCVNSSNTCAGEMSLDEIHYDSYDNFGNLRSQQDLVNGIGETYHYDNLHRIKSATRSANSLVIPTFSPTAQIDYSFEPSGNLLSKGDYATSYSYSGGSSGGPNAVKSVTKLDNSVVQFNYDSNGNLTSGDGLTLSYNGLNKPATIIRNSVTLAFEYGTDTQRYKQTADHGNKIVTTFYVDKLFEQIETTQDGSTTTEKRHYFGDHTVKTHKDSGKNVSYLHRNRLGSSSMITSGDKHLNSTSSFFELVLERRGYDVFGKPRDLYWGDSLGGLLASNISTRGFTDHEHLDSVELIHMNGRGYDYNLGRFLSVDPFIQMPGNSQSINPYSYGMNNPLAGTDPSGYIFWFVPMAIAAYNAYDSASAIADAAQTLADPNASTAEKLEATASAIGSVADPTPGNLGKRVVTTLRTAAKGKNTAKADVAPSQSKTKTEVKTEAPSGKTQAGDSGANQKQDAKAGEVSNASSSTDTFRSADGRLRNKDGTFAKDGGSKKKSNSDSEHGNSRNSDKEAVLYGKFDADGNFQKWGISQDPATRYTKKELDGGVVKEYRSGSRSEMLDKERKLVERFPGPENKEPWAGKKKPKAKPKIDDDPKKR